MGSVGSEPRNSLPRTAPEENKEIAPGDDLPHKNSEIKEKDRMQRARTVQER